MKKTDLTKEVMAGQDLDDAKKAIKKRLPPVVFWYQKKRCFNNEPLRPNNDDINNDDINRA